MLMAGFTDSLFRIIILRCTFGVVCIPVLISRRPAPGGKTKGGEKEGEERWREGMGRRKERKEVEKIYV